jgi:hypothetical protein
MVPQFAFETLRTTHQSSVISVSMQSNVREWTHVLLVNTPCLYLHSFCATGVSSGLATRVTLARVSRGEVGKVYYTGVDLLMINFLYRIACLFLGCVLNGTCCTSCWFRCKCISCQRPQTIVFYGEHFFQILEEIVPTPKFPHYIFLAVQLLD